VKLTIYKQTNQKDCCKEHAQKPVDCSAANYTASQRVKSETL